MASFNACIEIGFTRYADAPVANASRRIELSSSAETMMILGIDAGVRERLLRKLSPLKRGMRTSHTATSNRLD